MASKLAKQTGKVNRRDVAPLISWIREKLLHIGNRSLLPKEEQDYKHPLRWTDETTAKDLPPATLPGGIHHKLADNYYKDHDARRLVDPPTVLYTAENAPTTKLVGDASVVEANKRAEVNFGLPLTVPVPGFGASKGQWRRSVEGEQWHTKVDPALNALDKYSEH